MNSLFTSLDWAVFAIYFAIIAFTGWHFSRTKITSTYVVWRRIQNDLLRRIMVVGMCCGSRAKMWLNKNFIQKKIFGARFSIFRRQMTKLCQNHNLSPKITQKYFSDIQKFKISF